MTIIIKALKNIYNITIQRGNRIQLPLELIEHNDLYHKQKGDLQILQKGDVVSDNGMFIRFYENQEDIK